MSVDHSKMLKRMQRGLRDVRFLMGDEIPESGLAEFYSQQFPQRAEFLKQNWRWLYRVGNQEGIPSPMVAVLGDQIVGHGGLIPVTLSRNGEQHTAIWMVDFAVHPEHQRGVIGGGLVLTGMAACPLRAAFLNDRSWGMVDRLGWQSGLHTNAFQLWLRPELHSRMQSFARIKPWINWLARMSGKFTQAVWRARTLASKQYSVAPVSEESLAQFSHPSSLLLRAPRTAEFLRWRILAHPHRDQYSVISAASAKGGEYAAIVRILTVTDSDRQETDVEWNRRLHLLALCAEPHDDRALSKFFACIVHWALAQDVTQIVFVTSDPKIARIARYWFPLHKAQRFAFHADDGQGTAFLGGEDHYWELLDGDFEMMFEMD